MKFVGERDQEDPVIATHKYYLSWIKPYIENKKILDIGCWTGPMEKLLTHENYQLTAIDIEDEPLEYARKKFPKFKFVKTSIVGKRVPWKNKFDIVLFFMVLEHIPKGTEAIALKNINNVLKKGGSLFLTTMNNDFRSCLFDPAYFLAGHRHYSKRELANLLKKTGFSIQEIHYNGGFFMIFYTWMLYFFKHILHRREPYGDLMDKLLMLDYRSSGFTEIDIRAVKTRDLR